MELLRCSRDRAEFISYLKGMLCTSAFCPLKPPLTLGTASGDQVFRFLVVHKNFETDSVNGFKAS